MGLPKDVVNASYTYDSYHNFDTSKWNLDHIHRVPVTAMKGNSGHLALAIGAFETAMTIKSMVTGDIPYIKNCDDPCE